MGKKKSKQHGVIGRPPGRAFERGTAYLRPETWARLTGRAARLGISRLEAIRRAVDLWLGGGGA